MTNGERADRLIREARQIAGEMTRAIGDEAWNLATRRAQEALELAIKALLSEMTVDYPKIHDPAPVFAHAVSERNRRRRHGAGWTGDALSGAREHQRPRLLSRNDRHRGPSTRLGPARPTRARVRGGVAEAVAEDVIDDGP